MRFGLSLILSCLCASTFFGPTLAQTRSAEHVKVIYNDPPVSMLPQKRRRSATERPIVDARLEATVFASQIGDVIAAALDKDGNIYVVDQKRGRVIQLIDRAGDGRLDMRRTVASGLDRPSGVTVIDERLFVVDARAIWETSIYGGEMKAVANLQNSASKISPRWLEAAQDGGSLFLALTHYGPQDGGKIVAVNIETGAARLISTGDGPISAMAVGAGDAIWIASGDKILPVTGRTYKQASGKSLGAQVSGLVIPGQFADMAEVLHPWQENILASTGKASPHPQSAGDMTVLAVPTRFGKPLDDTNVFAKGFAAANQRSAWGFPGQMIIDKRGLFIVDQWSRTLWLISAASSKPVEDKPVPEIEDAPEEIEEVDAKDDPEEGRFWGSSIEAGSTIPYGSTIEGSKIEKGSSLESRIGKKKDEEK